MRMSGVKDFKRLKEVAKKTKCRIKLNTKNGMPFLMNKYRKRKVFFACLMIIIVFLYAESRFIWNIQIEGIDRIEEAKIREVLSEAGLDVGKRKSKIKTGEIINKVRLQMEDIAWMNISLKRNKHCCTNSRNNKKARNNTIRRILQYSF